MTQKSLSYASQAWLLIGWMHSVPGVLKLKHGKLFFETNQTGTLGKRKLKKLALQSGNPSLSEDLRQGKKVKVFDWPLEDIQKVTFPALYFSAGAHIHGADTRFRLSFIRPQNTAFDEPLSGGLLGGGVDAIKDIRQSRNVGKRWKAIFS